MSDEKPFEETRKNYPKIQIICCGESGQDVLNSPVLKTVDAHKMSVIMEGEVKHTNLEGDHFILKSSAPIFGELPLEEAERSIQNNLSQLQPLIDADVLFINCELGVDPCTGYLPTLASAARETGAFTMVVAHTMYPFYESQIQSSKPWLLKLEENSDVFIFIPFDALEDAIPQYTFKQGYHLLVRVVAKVIRDISNSFQGKGYRNLFRLDKSLLIKQIKDSKRVRIGLGKAYGKEAHLKSVDRALQCPLLEFELKEAALLMVTVAGDENLTLSQVKKIVQRVVDTAGNEKRLLWEVFMDNEPDRVDTLIIAFQ